MAFYNRTVMCSHRLSVIAICLSVLLLAVVVRANESSLVIQDSAGNLVAGAIIGVHSDAVVPAGDQPLVMDQIKRRFVPRVLLVNRGQSVHFPNRDDIRHHLYSFSPAKTFEMKLYKGEPTLPIQFDQAGIVALGCNIHDRMRGFIYVNPAREQAFVSDRNGVVAIDGDLPDSFFIWHEQLADPSQRIHLSSSDGSLRDGVMVYQLELLPAQDTSRHSFKKRY